MGAAAAEAPLRLPAAPPLAFCCYTSVLLLFAFSLPGSRASNQPAGGGSGGGGECPGGKGKSINCSGRTGRCLPLPLLRPDYRGQAGKGPGARVPGSWARGRARAEGRVRARGAGLGTGAGHGEWPCVRPCVSSSRARVARRVGRWRGRDPARRRQPAKARRVIVGVYAGARVRVVKAQGRERCPRPGLCACECMCMCGLD